METERTAADPRSLIRALVRTARPHQWVKNLFVWVPLIFSKEVTDAARWIPTLGGFVSFCLVSSTVYVLNDIHDRDLDRLHPVKKFRPIASGAISVPLAIRLAIAGAAAALSLGFFLKPSFGVVLVGYAVLNFFYTHLGKKIPYLDVLCIATGFLLRVFGGADVAQVTPSMYLIVVTFLLACFLGFGKRAHEMAQRNGGRGSRPVLRGYDVRLVNILLYIAGIATIITYVAYTLDAHTIAFFGTSRLVLTSPFPIFGIVRFMYLVCHPNQEDSPTERMLRDVPFLANLAVWFVLTTALIYRGH